MATVAGATGLSDRRMAEEPGMVTSSTPAITFASLEAESRTSHHLSPLAQLHSAFFLTPSGAINMITDPGGTASNCGRGLTSEVCRTQVG